MINACARVFFGVVCALAVCLELAVTPFLGQPCEEVADPEGFEVGFEGATDED